jgi:hypothetical protein
MSQYQDAAAMRKKLPVLSANMGVWEGFYRRFSPEGVPLSTHRSRLIMRLRDDAPLDQIYHQTNVYRFANGMTQVIESYGYFDGEKLNFGSSRDVHGWTLDDLSDPMRRSCFLWMKLNADTPQLKAGTEAFEMVNMGKDGDVRMRMTQYLLDGRIAMRTLIDEVRVTSDWQSRNDWASLPLDTP